MEIIHTTNEGYIFKLDLNGGIDKCVYNTGTYEQHIADIINKYVTKESVCIDVGANFGCHAIRMGKRGKKVICIEPMPISNRLEENLILNNINYEVHRCVAGNQNINNISIFTENQYLINNSDTKREPVLTYMKKIDDIVNEKINFIKIDVDGMEYDVLCGLNNTINKYKPIIVSELSAYIIEYTNENKNGTKPINDPKIVRQRWYNIVKFVLGKGYKITYVAYNTYFKVPMPQTPEDFLQYYDIIHKNNFSSTDVLFVPI